MGTTMRITARVLMGIRTKGRSAVQKCLCVMLGLSFVAATLAIDGSLDVPSLYNREEQQVCCRFVA